jgi:hypothetical protein
MERGLPIGCAPNVHVSLVLLPEECASLSGRSFPVRELRRRATRALVGGHLSRRFARYDRARRAPRGLRS